MVKFNINKSVVVLAGAAVDLIPSQWEKSYNCKIYLVTSAQYVGRYIR